MVVRNQFADVSAAFKNRDVPPFSMDAKSRPAVQKVGVMNNRRCVLGLRQCGFFQSIVKALQQANASSSCEPQFLKEHDCGCQRNCLQIALKRYMVILSSQA